jgi:hypothetical protein
MSDKFCWKMFGFVLLTLWVQFGLAADRPAKIDVQWDSVTGVSQTTPTFQVVVNPPLRRGTPVHDNAFRSIQDLGADYVRYVPWLPYPKLAVAELEPPANGETHWDFSLIDPITIDFLEATRGRPAIFNFSTIPQWMYKTEKPVPYPADPDEVTWNYAQGTELRDPSGKEVAEYYARLLSWYTQGGFIDEFGVRHESGYHYKIACWEVLNEIEGEHDVTPEAYTKLYDAIVTAVRKVQPDLKFVALALAEPTRHPEFFEYFLEPKNHRPGAPLDFISYHFYAFASYDQSPQVQQFTFFSQADGFLNVARYIESIRKRLSPDTKTMINEIGSISADDDRLWEPDHVNSIPSIPNSYWNLSGAMYAYIYGNLTSMGIHVAGQSQLVGYPTQYPSVSMVDWNNGKPNARYWVLKLLKDNFSAGDKLIKTKASESRVYALAVVTREGKRKILLVNKRDHPIEVTIAGASGGRKEFVDQTTAFAPPASEKLFGDKVTLGGYSVSAVILPYQ